MPSPREPFVRSPIGSRAAASAAASRSTSRDAGTRTPSNPSVTVPEAFAAASRCGVTVSPGASVASSSTRATSSPSRAPTSTTSTRPQPVTHGASPSSTRSSPSARTVRSGGPGRSPTREIPARRSPVASGASQPSRIPGVADPATARTTLWCWIHTNIVVRHPPANASMIGCVAAASSPHPPTSAGADIP